MPDSHFAWRKLTSACFSSRLPRRRRLKSHFRPRRPASRCRKPAGWSTCSRRPTCTAATSNVAAPSARASCGRSCRRRPNSFLRSHEEEAAGNNLVQGGVADATPPSFGPAPVPPVKAADGRRKTTSTGPAGAQAKTRGRRRSRQEAGFFLHLWPATGSPFTTTPPVTPTTCSMNRREEEDHLHWSKHRCNAGA